MVKRLHIILFFLLIASRCLAVTITGFAPARGQVGTLVTITGTNIGNPTAVSIGGKPAVIISSTATKLIGMVMPGAATGQVSIKTNSGTATSTDIFTVMPTLYPTQQQGNKIVGSNVVGGVSNQGLAVAISADGNTAAIGGYMDNDTIGCTFIFVRNGSNWIQQGNKLVSADHIATQGVAEGYSVAISADGNTVISGGPDDDSGNGAAWVYTRTGTTWAQQGPKLHGTGNVGPANEGFSVGLSADGNTAVIGGLEDDNQQGALWVFARTGSTWAQVGNKLVGTGGASGTGHGNAVAISADGNTIVDGGFLDNGWLGATWIFVRSGNGWVQQGNKLVGTSNAPFQYQAQGMSVAVSADGNTVIAGAGANGANYGGSFVFTRTGTTWAQQGPELTQLKGNWEGASVALSADGSVAFVGADGANGYAGTTFIYTLSNGVWTYQNSLLATGGSPDSAQGSGVGYSADGTTVIIGGVGDNNGIGAAWVFIEPSQLPVVTTLPATNITAYTASLNGTVNDIGIADSVVIEYSTQPDLSGSKLAKITTASRPNQAGVATATYAAAVSGLLPGTTYYFRITATNIYGTASGTILSFETPNIQIITFPPIANVVYGHADTDPGATSTNSTVPITYTSSNNAIATITSSGLVHITGIGTATLTANQVSNATYAAATPVSQTITILPAPLTITADDKTRAFGAADPVFTYTLTGLVYNETPSVLTLLPGISSNASAASHPGSYTLTAAGAAAANYTITYVPGTLTIIKAQQTIKFNTIPIQKLNNGGITLKPVASSGLPVTLSSANIAVAGTNGLLVSFYAAGTVTLTAYQAGDTDYNPATATQLLTIVATIVIPNTFTPNNDNVNDTWSIKNIATYTTCTINVYNRNGQIVYSSVGYAVPWDGKYMGKPAPAGTYYYIIDLKDGDGPVSGWVSIIR